MFPDPDLLHDAGTSVISEHLRQILRFFSFLHGFLEHLGQNGGFRVTRGRGGAILTPNELVVMFGGLHVCVQFGENRRRNATVRVSTDGQTHTRSDAKRFYYLSHAICFSYGADKYANNVDTKT